MILDIIKWVVPWLLSIVKDRTPDNVGKALDLIGPVLEEMIQHGGRLPVSARAPYEVRMIRILDAAGLLEEA